MEQVSFVYCKHQEQQKCIFLKPIILQTCYFSLFISSFVTSRYDCTNKIVRCNDLVNTVPHLSEAIIPSILSLHSIELPCQDVNVSLRIHCGSSSAVGVATGYGL